MSRADYRRPAWYQVEREYKCKKCGMQQKPCAGSSAIMPCPSCGGYVELQSQSYPANVDDWDVSRRDTNSPWINERNENHE